MFGFVSSSTAVTVPMSSAAYPDYLLWCTSLLMAKLWAQFSCTSCAPPRHASSLWLQLWELDGDSHLELIFRHHLLEFWSFLQSGGRHDLQYKERTGRKHTFSVILTIQNQLSVEIQYYNWSHIFAFGVFWWTTLTMLRWIYQTVTGYTTTFQTATQSQVSNKYNHLAPTKSWRCLHPTHFLHLWCDHLHHRHTVTCG